MGILADLLSRMYSSPHDEFRLPDEEPVWTHALPEDLTDAQRQRRADRMKQFQKTIAENKARRQERDRRDT